ncbi:PilZ domain-containing protein [Agrobacterium larrymoorei]|uniref:PilZ domain-containing protein n=1 Tax=Agrobacterium larrymoorei TaxID=160699 RepID=A0A4D7DTW9_9HYPH|nr:PilZ domain-containing protein [Agrobacterium larrymoorei]QCI97786.1 PilZ domain-containing protein [Agrobacterium larrymoorei]QYA06769.1 PilZ domain-containing protein [Agrobacterium larrymoorei]
MFASRSVNTFAAHKPAETVESAGSVSVGLSGRLMLPSEDEFDCTATEMTAETAKFTCFARPSRGERIIAYLQHIGRLEGKVATLTPDGFTISIAATERKREKLAAQLAWIAKRQALGLPEDRRHDRLSPRNPKAELMLNDGNLVPCRIIDLSLSGAAIEIDIRPEMGSNVRLGNMAGRIVRHFMEGVAIEFDSVQSKDALIEFL